MIQSRDCCALGTLVCHSTNWVVFIQCSKRCASRKAQGIIFKTMNAKQKDFMAFKIQVHLLAIALAHKHTCKALIIMQIWFSNTNSFNKCGSRPAKSSLKILS